MNLTDLHRRLLADVLAVGGDYPLALTGGYAVQAHGLVSRLSRDLDVATENPDPMADIAATVRTGLESSAGWYERTPPAAACAISYVGGLTGQCGSDHRPGRQVPVRLRKWCLGFPHGLVRRA